MISTITLRKLIYRVTYIYKKLQGSSLSLLVASLVFKSSGFSLSHHLPLLLFKCSSVSLRICDREQGSVPPSWDNHVRGLHKGNTIESHRAPLFLLLQFFCIPNTVLLNFALQSHASATTYGVCLSLPAFLAFSFPAF